MKHLKNQRIFRLFVQNISSLKYKVDFKPIHSFHFLYKEGDFFAKMLIT